MLITPPSVPPEPRAQRYSQSNVMTGPAWMSLKIAQISSHVPHIVPTDALTENAEQLPQNAPPGSLALPSNPSCVPITLARPTLMPVNRLRTTLVAQEKRSDVRMVPVHIPRTFARLYRAVRLVKSDVGIAVVLIP